MALTKRRGREKQRDRALFHYWSSKLCARDEGQIIMFFKARVKRRTAHKPNRMLMRVNKGFFSFALNSAHMSECEVRRLTRA